MSAAREWAVFIALTAYDVVLEPAVRGFKRGWALGKARHQ
jgi:hypothetical protein